MSSGRKRKGRNVTGILLLDKPDSMSSNSALQRAKRIYQAAKAGHTGNLDPLATGMLPLCFGDATKFSEFLLNASKCYRGTVALGTTTTTGDKEGEVTATAPIPAITAEQLRSILDNFTGTIQQQPPMYSALKQNGVALYKLAREGKTVDRPLRTVEIYHIELLHMTPESFEIEVRCSKGTYIRTLAEDIGTNIGCGAHLAALRRTAVGDYTEANMVTMQQLLDSEEDLSLLDAYLLPLDSILQQFPELKISATGEFYLRQGQPVQVSQAPANGWVRLYNGQEHFIGVGQILDDGRVSPKRMMQP